MTRPKGSRDTFPRYYSGRDTRFQSRTPGHTSIAVRLYGPKAVMRWFASLNPGQRAAVVTKQRKESKP